MHVASTSGNNLILENLNTLGNGISNNLYFINYAGNSVHYYSGAMKSIGTTSSTARLGFFTSASTLTTGLNEHLTILDNGNVGVGNINPAKKLDVGGDANLSGDLTVRGGLGVLFNTAGSLPLKYYTRTVGFTAILPAFGTSVEGTIGFTGVFTTPPEVMVGDIVSTGGTAGQLYRVQLVIYDVTTTSCHCRLINTSDGAVNYNVTWNIICIGN